MEIVSSSRLSPLALATDLARGESEAISIAHEQSTLLVLDDGLARRHGALLGVHCTGKLGVLLKV
jgi:predicted nucleic acid-binding protein